MMILPGDLFSYTGKISREYENMVALPPSLYTEQEWRCSLEASPPISSTRGIFSMYISDIDIHAYYCRDKYRLPSHKT
jgi:hypothetical protein